MIRRVSPQGGFSVSSRWGWFYLGVGGEIYRFQISFGGFAICWQRKWKAR